MQYSASALLAPDAGLRAAVFPIPLIQSSPPGNQADEIQEAVQALRRALRRVARAAATMACDCSSSSRSLERVFLRAEQLHAGPEQQAQGGAGEQEEEAGWSSALSVSSDLDVGHLADHQNADDLRR